MGESSFLQEISMTTPVTLGRSFENELSESWEVLITESGARPIV
jgi:hypothetical protein